MEGAVEELFDEFVAAVELVLPFYFGLDAAVAPVLVRLEVGDEAFSSDAGEVGGAGSLDEFAGNGGGNVHLEAEGEHFHGSFGDAESGHCFGE